ncbi:hypothetical protein COOONC_15729 [Cooperia oncophora]
MRVPMSKERPRIASCANDPAPLGRAALGGPLTIEKAGIHQGGHRRSENGFQVLFYGNPYGHVDKNASDVSVKPASKTISAFLNTEGGNIYVGIDSYGTIRGVRLTASLKEHFFLSLSYCISQFKPAVPPDLVKVHFIELDNTTLLEHEENNSMSQQVEDVGHDYDSTAESETDKGPTHHTIGSTSCLCEDTVETMESKLYLAVVQVLKSPDGTFYQNDEGCAYRRRHGSNKMIIINDIVKLMNNGPVPRAISEDGVSYVLSRESAWVGFDALRGGRSRLLALRPVTWYCTIMVQYHIAVQVVFLLHKHCDLVPCRAVRVVLWLLPAVFHKTGRADHLPQLKQVIFCTSLLMYAASPTKLLLLTEKLSPGIYLPVGDYAFLVWNVFAAFLLDLSWKTYFSYPPSSYVLLEHDEVSRSCAFVVVY